MKLQHAKKIGTIVYWLNVKTNDETKTPLSTHEDCMQLLRRHKALGQVFHENRRAENHFGELSDWASTFRNSGVFCQKYAQHLMGQACHYTQIYLSKLNMGWAAVFLFTWHPFSTDVDQQVQSSSAHQLKSNKVLKHDSPLQNIKKLETPREIWIQGGSCDSLLSVDKKQNQNLECYCFHTPSQTPNTVPKAHLGLHPWGLIHLA